MLLPVPGICGHSALPSSIILTLINGILVEIERIALSVAQEYSQDIKLYTGEYCPYCRRVSKELDRLGLDYESVNADADGREEVIRLSRQRAIPILTIDDEVLVDSTHIIRELRRRYA